MRDTWDESLLFKLRLTGDDTGRKTKPKNLLKLNPIVWCNQGIYAKTNVGYK